MINMIYKIYLLSKRVKDIKRGIPMYSYTISKRSELYHNGRLDINDMMEEYINSKNIEIFSIKREIVKLKNN